jgi:hypothetical protein
MEKINKECVKALLAPDEDAFTVGKPTRVGLFSYEYPILYQGEGFGSVTGVNPVEIHDMVMLMNKGYRLGWADGASCMQRTVWDVEAAVAAVETPEGHSRDSSRL